MSLFDTIGSLLGKSDGSATSVPEALVAALGNQEGGLGGLDPEIRGCRAGKHDLVLGRHRRKPGGGAGRAARRFGKRSRPADCRQDRSAGRSAVAADRPASAPTRRQPDAKRPSAVGRQRPARSRSRLSQKPNELTARTLAIVLGERFRRCGCIRAKQGRGRDRPHFRAAAANSGPRRGRRGRAAGCAAGRDRSDWRGPGFWRSRRHRS